MLNCKTDQHDFQPGGTPGTAEQDMQIRKLLLMGANLEEILSIVETHKDAKKAGIHQMLDIISKIQRKELSERIHAMEELLSPIVGARPNLKRDISEDSNEVPAPVPRDPKRARKAPKGKGSNHEESAKDTSRLRVYRCPGKKGQCQEHKRRQWRSRMEFVQHFEENHVNEYKATGCFDGSGGFKCLDCEEGNSFSDPGAGVFISTHARQLAFHLWAKHMSPKAALKPAQSGVVQVKHEPRESSDTPYGKLGGTELGDQLQSTATLEKARIKSEEPSATQHGYSIDAASEVFVSPRLALSLSFPENMTLVLIPSSWGFSTGTEITAPRHPAFDHPAYHSSDL